MRYTYPCVFAPDEGGVSISFPDRARSTDL